MKVSTCRNWCVKICDVSDVNLELNTCSSGLGMMYFFYKIFDCEGFVHCDPKINGFNNVCNRMLRRK